MVILKVLWFSNTPALGIEHLRKDATICASGGWLYALNTTVQHAVDLHIAFQYPHELAPFTYQSTQFHPVYTGNILINRLSERFGRGSRTSEALTEQYMEIVRRVQPDIIHIHGTENPYIHILGLTEIPVVVSIQGIPTVIAHKFCAGLHGRYLKVKGGKLGLKQFVLGRKTFKYDLSILRMRAARERQSLEKARYILGRTAWDRRVSQILAPQSRYFTSNELLRDAFYKTIWSRPAPASPKAHVIFTVSSDSYFKGFETLCHTLKLLHEQEMNIEWRVAGIDSDSLVYKITRREFGDSFPSHGLVLLGKVDAHTLTANMLESHLYVMPSHIENSPNSLCEAMLVGMPCIATFAGGTGSILRDGEDGILVQGGDPWALAGAIQELTLDPNKADQYGSAARKKALIRHDRNTVPKDLVSIYERVLADAKSEHCLDQTITGNRI